MPARRSTATAVARTWWRPGMITAMVLALVASGCGRSSGNKKAVTTSSSPPAAAAGDFGTLKSVCGPGSAKGATDAGVTDTSINVSTMADPGATADPGLDQELFDSADAFVGWCNAAGGILGRKLSLHKRDSALFNVGAQMVASCNQPDFMLVGNGEALDATGVPQRLGCKLPELAAYVVSTQAGTAALSIQPIPTRIDVSSLGGAYQALARADPEATKHFGILNIGLASIKDGGLRDRAAGESLGFKVVDYEELSPVVSSWRPIVENLKSHGVQVLTMLNSPDNLAALYKTMADVGYYPKYGMFDTNHYDTKLTSQAGTTLNGNQGGAFINSSIVPFELANQYPATKQYLDILRQYANGAKPKALGVSSFSAWLLFAGAVKACGSNLTRQCVLDHAQSTHDWTAGGIHAPSQPGNGLMGGTHCFTLMKVTASGFSVDKSLTRPTSGIFNCNSGNVFTLKGFPPSS